MKFFSQILFIVRKEADYLLAHPRKLMTGAVLAILPALYCVLYISSVWDPDNKTSALAVAVVNLDEGVKYRERTFNVGWEITTRLEDSGRFGFVMSSDEQKARAMVSQGKLAFAVIIPRDFSANAVPGAEAGAGKVVVYTSQGNNFETAAIAKHFAETLGHQINESLNERRWELVLHNSVRMQRDVQRAHQATDRIRASAADLVATAGVNHQNIDRLNAGIHELAKALPARVDSLGGSAEGLANSVEPVLEIAAPVQNSGSGFAANVIPAALWLGATVAVILIHLQVLPVHAQFFSRSAKVAGKIFLPACVVLLQSLLVFIAVRYVLNIQVLLPWALALTLVISALTFLLIIFALTKAFGDAGNGIATCLLAVQLSSSGGILPVELSGGLFAQISPWLPLTWVVESVKASMFGAFDGDWTSPLVFVLLAALAGFLLSCSVGRWRFVNSLHGNPN